MPLGVFRLAHLSDAHLNPLPPFSWRALLNKRATGYVNWLRSRRHMHDMAALEVLLADLVGQAADHVAMTGDVAHIGLPDEFEAAAAFLDRLGPRERVSFVPGNHDAYVPESLPACLARLAPWVTSDEGARGFPYLRVRGPVALIGLSSAVPTPPLNATGVLGHEQVERAEVLLHYAKSCGLVRVVLVHHAPQIGGSKPSKCLTDAADFEAMLARAGAELVLHGHNHTTSIALRPGPDGPVPIVGVPSASVRPDGRHEPAGYHLFEIEPGEARPRIALRRRLLGPSGAFIDNDPLDLGHVFG